VAEAQERVVAEVKERAIKRVSFERVATEDK